jgi:hypothetical protein
MDWMRALAAHYEDVLRKFPDARPLLVSDIDGTILDMRNMIASVLHGYDRAHGTRYFERLTAHGIAVHENQVDQLLAERNVPAAARPAILDYYVRERWSPEAIVEMHRPFAGVLEAMRWFQLQPNTSVGLLTGRPDKLRGETLRCLNQLGAPYRLTFTDDLLFMNPGDWEEGVTNTKVAGIRHFSAAGYHPFAFIDNEPANLAAVGAAYPNGRLLLLHADTIFESKRQEVPTSSVGGKEYHLDELIPAAQALPQRVQLVWHGVNDEANLRQFLDSSVRWAEVDARMEPALIDVILRGDAFADRPPGADEQWLTLRDTLATLRRHKRAIKIDLKGGPPLHERVLDLVREAELVDTDLWFNARIDDLGKAGFALLRAAHPDAIRQCPADWLVPLLRASPDTAREVLEMLRGWGITRFSFAWTPRDLPELVGLMDRWGYEINIYKVADLEQFLQAVLLLPSSVTSDFNFPKWHHYGRGPGKGGAFHAHPPDEKEPK